MITAKKVLHLVKI